jgi:hypothetical protein
MSDQPLRPIEEQLNRYATTRRANVPPFELHPVTRAALHDEIARTHTVPQRTPSKSYPTLDWLWPRLALAAGIAALILLAVVQFVPSHQTDVQLARLESQPQPQPPAPLPEFDLALRDDFTPVDQDSFAQPMTAAVPESATPPDSPPSEQRPITARTPQRESAKTTLNPSLASQPAPRTSSAATTEAATEPLTMERFGQPQPQTAPSQSDPASAQPIVARPALTAPPEASLLLSSRSATAAVESDPALDRPTPIQSQSLQFTQLRRYRENFQSPPTPDVLRSFQFVQSDRTVQIIDSDGSIYHGSSESPPTAAPTRFTVTGTNRTAGNRVAFEGVLQQSTPGSDTAIPNRFGITLDQLTPATAVVNDQPGTTRIQGQVTIGDTVRLEIVAVPALTPSPAP